MSAREDFWSRRKARVAQQEALDAEAVETAKLAEDHAALEEQSDDEILEGLGLPDPDTLQKGDDFSGFMAKAVPDRIRRRALRKLWLSNPALANLDGLIDYGEDFTDKAKIIENMQTAYQVGKGMLEHVEELARQEAEKAEAAAMAETTGEGEAAQEAAEESVVAENGRPAVELAEDAADGAEHEGDLVPGPTDEAAHADVEQSMLSDDAQTLPAPRRRMRFAFETKAESMA